jgi:hypothetical protein
MNYSFDEKHGISKINFDFKDDMDLKNVDVDQVLKNLKDFAEQHEELADGITLPSRDLSMKEQSLHFRHHQRNVEQSDTES